jgi:hypothetical protein
MNPLRPWTVPLCGRPLPAHIACSMLGIAKSYDLPTLPTASATTFQ